MSLIHENDSPNLQLHQNALYEILIEFDKVCKKHNISYILFAGTMLGAIRHKGFIPWDDDLDVLMLRSDYDKFMKVAFHDLNHEKFFLQKEFSEHWPMFFSKLRMNNTTCLEKYHPKDKLTHQGVYIDIFPCDNAYDNVMLRKFQFVCSKIVIAKSLYRRGYETDSFKKKIFMQICRLFPQQLFVNIVQNKKNTHSNIVHCFFGGASSISKSVFERKLIIETTNALFVDKNYPVSKHYDELLTILYNDYMTIPDLNVIKIKKHAILVDLNKPWEEYVDYRDNMEFKEFTRSIR